MASRTNPFKSWLAVAIVALSVCASAGAQTYDSPIKRNEIKLDYQEKPLREALRDFFASQGVMAVVSDKITSNVTGKFSMRADAFFSNMVSVFGLGYYYDGSVMYVYAGNEMASRVINLDDVSPSRFKTALREAGVRTPRLGLRIDESERIAYVSGPPRFVENVAEIATLLSDRERGRRALAPASAPAAAAEPKPIASTFVAHKLRYAWAQDTTLTVGGREVVVPGVASTLRRLAGNYSRESTTAAVTRMPVASNTSGKLRGQGLQSVDGVGLRAGGVDVRDASSGGALSEPRTAEGFASGLVNVSLPRIEADARTNMVIVHDVPERIKSYGELIALLDVKPVLIEIEAAILDVSSDSTDKLGINWGNSQTSIVYSRGGNTNALGQAAEGAATAVLNAAAPVTSGVTTIISNLGRVFMANVELLAKQGKAYVQARPSVLAINNHEAVLENTQTFYVRLAGERDVDLFNITAGTMLRVTAALVDEGEGKNSIRLAVRIEDGSITGQVVDQIPIVQRGTIGTHAMIPEGRSLLIGGYSYNISRDETSKIPLLGDIPGLGALFTFKNNGTTRAERMFLITPKIINP
jgi:type III secretion protein C